MKIEKILKQINDAAVDITECVLAHDGLDYVPLNVRKIQQAIFDIRLMGLTTLSDHPLVNGIIKECDKMDCQILDLVARLLDNHESKSIIPPINMVRSSLLTIIKILQDGANEIRINGDEGDNA